MNTNSFQSTNNLISGHHSTQLRKGTSIPYITHIWTVATLVAEYGGTEDQIISGLLHDAIEDAGDKISIGEIRAQFGDTVARIVEACTEPEHHGKSWEERKQHTIDTIPGLPEEAKLVIAADKLANLHSISRALRMEGKDMWKRFNRGRTEQLWYYRGVLEALESKWSHRILAEYRSVLDNLEIVTRLS